MFNLNRKDMMLAIPAAGGFAFTIALDMMMPDLNGMNHAKIQSLGFIIGCLGNMIGSREMSAFGYSFMAGEMYNMLTAPEGPSKSFRPA